METSYIYKAVKVVLNITGNKKAMSFSCNPKCSSIFKNVLKQLANILTHWGIAPSLLYFLNYMLDNN